MYLKLCAKLLFKAFKAFLALILLKLVQIRFVWTTWHKTLCDIYYPHIFWPDPILTRCVPQKIRFVRILY